MTQQPCRVLLLADIAVEPLRDLSTGDEIAPESLLVPAELQHRIRAWSNSFDASGQISAEEAHAEDLTEFWAEGYRLAGDLQSALGQATEVYYLRNRRFADLTDL